MVLTRKTLFEDLCKQGSTPGNPNYKDSITSYIMNYFELESETSEVTKVCQELSWELKKKWAKANRTEANVLRRFSLFLSKEIEIQLLSTKSLSSYL